MDSDDKVAKAVFKAVSYESDDGNFEASDFDISYHSPPLANVTMLVYFVLTKG